jgi:MoxR-like ATPase
MTTDHSETPQDAPRPEPSPEGAPAPGSAAGPAGAAAGSGRSADGPTHHPEHEKRRFADAVDRLRAQVGHVVLGQEEAVDQLLTGLLAGGHVLLEGVPGIAKTLLAKLLARSLALDFSRIQFTPDLMPSDVIGTSVFDMQERAFQFRPGPVFAQVVLIDEINRAPAKTQAALFEVMEERQITYDGVRHPMREPFFVVATQNPIEQEGTYRLPEAQLDRFLFRVRMDYPALATEKDLLRRFKDDFAGQRAEGLEPVLGAEELLACRALVERVHITDALCDYIAELVCATREHASLYLGASPRASLGILRAAKATALLEGRDFVLPEDVQAAALPVLNHRILLTSERELEGVEPEAVVRDILAGIDVPR